MLQRTKVVDTIESNFTISTNLIKIREKKYLNPSTRGRRQLLKSDIIAVDGREAKYPCDEGQQQCYYNLIRGIVPLREYSFNVYNTSVVWNKRIHG